MKKTASDVEDGEADEVLSLVGSVDDIWSEVVLSSEENTFGIRVLVQVMFEILVE